MSEDIAQGSDEWRQARCGSLGASSIAEALAKPRSGNGVSASRANLMAELITERLTGIPTDGFKSGPMARGNEVEALARAAYEWCYDVTVDTVGLIRHPRIAGAHASPDGLIGVDGLIEIKCPNTATHLATLAGSNIKGVYGKQMQWQMACTGRQWCDFVSFDDRLPEAMHLHVERVQRDDQMIAELESGVAAFIAELEAEMANLVRLYKVTPAIHFAALKLPHIPHS